MQGIPPKVITYAAVICACCFRQLDVKALQLLEALLVQGFQLVVINFNGLPSTLHAQTVLLHQP